MSEHASAVVVPRFPHGRLRPKLAPAVFRGSDGASCYGQTHSSCSRTTTRLITVERKVDTVELTRLSQESAMPAPANGMRAIDNEVDTHSVGGIM